MNNAARLCLLGSLERSIRDYLTGHPDGHERVAIVLFRRFKSPDGLPESDRFVATEFHPFGESWITESSTTGFSYSLRPLRLFFQRCEEEGLVFGFVHNHPPHSASFSSDDEENERVLMQAIANRNGKDSHLVAMMLCDGKWYARIRQGKTPEDICVIRHIAIIGDRIDIHTALDSRATADTNVDDNIWARQAAAFGKPFVDKLRGLRVGVVGCSGTGGPSATLLARAGIGELILVDHDQLEKSNLNRVRGAWHKDVGRHKAEITRDFIHNMELGTTAIAIDALLDISPEAVDALTTCDVIFGCTDDDLGRQALNAMVSYYGIAYIDLGLGGQILENAEGQPHMAYQEGRVSTVLPEFGECLFCQRVTSEKDAKRQQAIRENPDITKQELKERYLDGGHEPSPGVGPFTSAIADLAVATLFDLITPYRQLPGELRRDQLLIDFVRMRFRSVAETGNSSCPYCGTRENKLKRAVYRLNRPALGRTSFHA